MGYVDNLADSLGTSGDILKLILVLLASSPLAIPLPYLAPALIHLYSIGLSSWFLLGIFGLYKGFGEVLIDALGTYFIVKYVRHKQMPWLVFALTMGHMVITHAVRLSSKTEMTTVDISATQMVLVQKLTTFAWNVHDGRQDETKLDAEQKDVKITKLPGLLEFLGYCFFFPTVMVGPTCTFKRYQNFANGSLFRDPKTNQRLKTLPSGRFKASIQRICSGLVACGLYAVINPRYNFSLLKDPSLSWFKLAIYLQLAGAIVRARYYTVWCMSEASFTLSGAGYDILKKDYKAGRNVNIRQVEFAQNMRGVFTNWNINTNNWLKDTIYKRVVREGKKPGFVATMLTFLTSAVWHGLHPAYATTFFFGGLVQTLGQYIRQTIRPFFLQPGATSLPRGSPAPPSTILKTIYDGISILVTTWTLNYICMPFELFDTKETAKAYANMYYIGHWIMAGLMAFYWAGGLKYLKAAVRARDRVVLEKKVEEKKL